MRAIFSSSRVETAEGVATFLRQAGIEVLLRHGRSYHGRRSGQFSYLQPISSVEELPSVWVCHSADQTRARALLLQAKLVESTRPDGNGGDQGQVHSAYVPRPRWQFALRIAIATMIVVGLGLCLFRLSLGMNSIALNRHQAPDHLRQAQNEGLDDQVAVRVHLQTVRAPRHQ